MSPQDAKRLVGHSAPQPEAGDIVEKLRWSAASTEIDEAFTVYGTMLDKAAAEIERLRTALRAVRASTNPRWIDQIIKDALREESR